jgi:hypothetical protein
MKSAQVVLATILFFFFPLTLLAQHGTTTSASTSSVSHSSPPSPAPAMQTSSAPSSHASSGSHTSSGSTSSRGSSSSHSSATPPKHNETQSASSGQGKKDSLLQSKDDKVKVKDDTVKDRAKPETSSAAKDRGEKEHAKRSWLPWKKHSDNLAKNSDRKDKDKDKENKKEKCKPGKPCRDEVKVAQNSEPKTPPCKPGKTCACPAGSSLGKNGRCVTTPPNNGNCLGTGRPCNLNQNNCNLLAAEIQREELQLERIQTERQSACAQGPSNQECLSLNMDYDRESERLQQLRREYTACLRP